MMPTPAHQLASRVGLIACAVLLTVACAFAQSKSLEDAAASSANRSEPAPPKRANPAVDASTVIMTPERQAAALKFAELHHPELYQLLHGLKQARRSEYQQAIRQLYNDSERLARFKERAPHRYELSLAEWQLDSRLRLLVARMTMSSDDPELEAQLQILLKKRFDTRLALLRLDRERQAARLTKLDDQIQEMESDRESAIQKDLLQIQRSLGVVKRPLQKQDPPNKQPAPKQKN